MKVRIILKAKKDFGTTKVGEILTLYNSIFDAMTGIAFYPIDRAQWALVAYDLFTGLKDKNGKEIYAGDIMSWMSPQKLYPSRDYIEQRGHVHFDSQKAGFYVQYKEYPNYCLANMHDAAIIGNVYENKDLLK